MRIIKVFTFCTTIFILFFLIIPFVSAHDAYLTYTAVTIRGNEIKLSYTTTYNNILEYYPEKNKKIEDIDLKFFTEGFKKGFWITNNRQTCKAQLLNSRNDIDIKSIEYNFELKCKEKLHKLRFNYNLFFDVSKAHENIVKIYVDGEDSEFLFTNKDRNFDLSIGADNTRQEIYHTISGGFAYFVLGVKHILTGYDHILFLIGLLVVTVSVRSILKIVTSFTLAHSITLIISSLGIFVLSPRLTESVIAVSIMYVAGENLLVMAKFKWPKKYKFLTFYGDTAKRRYHTFLFGLIHGFGFSYILKEVGLPKGGIVKSLLLFNVGVEFGQLCIVVLFFPILWYLRKTKKHVLVINTSSVIIGLVALFWFIQRVTS